MTITIKLTISGPPTTLILQRWITYMYMILQFQVRGMHKHTAPAVLSFATAQADQQVLPNDL